MQENQAMPRFSRYRVGPNTGSQAIATLINDFNQACDLLPRVVRRNNPRIMRAIIARLERMALQIIARLSDRHVALQEKSEESFVYDIRWLAANRREFAQLLEYLRQIAADNQYVRPEADRAEYENLMRNFKSRVGIIGEETINSLAAGAAAATAGVVGAASALALGASSFAMFGGPVVGGAVMGSTGLAGAIVTGGSAAFAYRSVLKSGPEKVEEMIREEVRNPEPGGP